MSTYTVTAVKKEWGSDRRHRHIAGVYSDIGDYYPRSTVVASINGGNIWNSRGGGYTARIHALHYCPVGACLASPYIATNPDSSLQDNLENLPER